MMLRPRLLVPVLVLGAVVGAQAPSTADLAQRAHRLSQRLSELGDVEKPSDEQKAQLAAKEKELADLVALCTKGDGFTERHFLEAGSPLLSGFPHEALAISEAGVARFPQSRFLHDHVGYAHTAAAGDRPCAAQLSSLRAGEAAFRKALQCTPDTWHAHMGLYQVLDVLGQCDEALRELDVALKDDEAAAAVRVPWLRRASLLMRGGKPEDAIAVLQGVEPDDDDKVYLSILRLRAAALAKDLTVLDAAAKELRALDDSPRTIVEVADALATAGKKDDALKLLAKRPARTKTWKDDDERIAQIWLQSAAALEVVLKATDLSAKGPLRGALTKSLEHTFLVYDGGNKVDLTSSPLAMATLASNCPRSNEKDWANRIALLLSLRTMADHQPSKLESIAIGTQPNKPAADDVPALLAAARFAVGDPEQGGVLTGLRVLEQVVAPGAAPAKRGGR